MDQAMRLWEEYSFCRLFADSEILWARLVKN